MTNKQRQTPINPSGSGRPVTKDTKAGRQPIRKSGPGRKTTAGAKRPKGI